MLQDDFAIGDRVIFNKDSGRWARREKVAGTIVDIRQHNAFIKPDKLIYGTVQVTARWLRDIEKETTSAD